MAAERMAERMPLNTIKQAQFEKAFKGLLDKYMPNWKTYKRELDNLPVAY
ncbi:hypothetical protein [Confluentibacter flavum]|nr:hypothetical protein [Confluentibacter flavum]